MHQSPFTLRGGAYVRDAAGKAMGALNRGEGVSSFTDDLLVKVLAEERNGLGLFEVAEPFAFDIGFLGSGETITVPIGFRTDFASIPWFACKMAFSNERKGREGGVAA
jgi:hypothetical protein